MPDYNRIESSLISKLDKLNDKMIALEIMIRMKECRMMRQDS